MAMAQSGKKARGAARSVSYKSELRHLQIALVRAHRHVISHGRRVLVIFEGRDGSGKDGSIKRITEHLSPRETRVVALGKPSDREAGQWYFQRYTAHLPSAGEFVLFNRSWYNRAGVEPVMHFCSPGQTTAFLREVVPFEHMLAQAGILLIKYYLDINRDEQRSRLKARARDPLTQWKSSPVDAAAQRHWDDYTQARDRMLRRSHALHAPWVIVKADDKKLARVNILRDLVHRIDHADLSQDILRPDDAIVFDYHGDRGNRLAR
jgi:polyphosphate kinase 2